MLEAVARYAPSETVREKVMAAKEKYRSLFGEPTELQQMQSEGFCGLVAQRIEELEKGGSKGPFDPPVRKSYYNPDVGPVPMIKRGRGPGEPVPYKVFDDPEPAAAASPC